MVYTPKLNPKRGFMIEKAQPFTSLDLNLAKRVLDENDELVIGVGNAKHSHAKGYLMTAGERIELIDKVLQSDGINPNRYMILPIENHPEDNTQWLAEVMMMTPRWSTFYTRNFLNASIFSKFKRQHRYNIETEEEQNPDKDYFELLAMHQAGKSSALKELSVYVPDTAIETMRSLGIFKRADTVYNRKNADFNEEIVPMPRALFLGGFQPFTGIHSEGTGHIGVVKQALEKRPQVVIAIGSAQESHKDSDPLTAGKRIETIRYSLQANGVDASRFFILPIKDIEANAAYSTKVVSMCPSFDSLMTGNDWSKELIGEGNYEVIPLIRTGDQRTNMPISATRIRETIKEMIKKNHSKSESITDKTICEIKHNLESLLDPATIEILEPLGFYSTMKFLSFAKE